MTYVPAAGDRARVVLEGPITQVDPVTKVVKLGNAQVGSVNFKPTDGIVRELEKVAEPERKWRRNDYVLDAEGKVFRRTERDTWLAPNGREVFETDPVRPLTLLVRDGVAQ